MLSTTLNSKANWFDSHFDALLSDYFAFLKIPSISTNPAHKKDILAAAGWLKSYLLGIGFEVEVWQTSSHPVVFAHHFVSEECPTLLLYHHYDVQPTDPLELWRSPPFEPTLCDGSVFARGASDNKGQCFYTLSALKAFMTEKKRLNIKLFIEGEEECGSMGSSAILKEKREELAADYLLIIDMNLPAKDKPAITLGLRGIVTLEVSYRNSRTDLHSGLLGGVALSPNRALLQTLAALWDKEGRVAIPGFYDGVEEREEGELAALGRELKREEVQAQFGVHAFCREGDYTLWEMNTVRPTVEINGISGGYTGEGFKTVIPAEAKAKISCRLVPGQDPDVIGKRLETFLKERAPSGIEVEVARGHGGKAVRAGGESRIVQVAAEAFEAVFGRACEKVLSGASVPIVAELTEASGAEVALIGVALGEDDIHAPNEHFELKRLRQGFLVMSEILEVLGSSGRLSS